ncbi:aminopeptidase [Polaromonas sp.]|uniref:aminopeptidase n=1 Tax=Polaromonas sp. TaxID=1869339 RepID=UPI0025FD291F|nr:aminopeptidase [Polaromonas sp.]
MSVARTLLALGACIMLLGGCSTVGYYWQSVSGHMKMVNAARPVEEWIGDAQTPERLKTRLALSQRIRQFAVTDLKLPDNASYHRYADLKRSAVVWSVMAAPELSLTLKTFCFPVAGCVGYRGYFNEAEARTEGARLKADGLEVGVFGIPAYSTLGWMNWAGGDPLLNTFINYPEGELARLIFHELAHQVVYASGDTMFNESFATTVERLGSQRWLQTWAGDAARVEYAAFEKRRQDFRALTLATRRELEAIYKEDTDSGEKNGKPAATAFQLEAKAAAMQRLRDNYAKLKISWGGYSGYDNWIANANNASLGAQAAYDELVPGFEALFEREGRDWQRFYDAVKRLATLPKDERRKALKTNL